MEDLNRRVKKSVEKWCNEKHTTTKRIPNQHYLLEEKAILLPIPHSRYRIKKMQNRKISPDSFVSINSNKYSVPVKYVGKTVQFRIIYGFQIEIFDTKDNFIMSFEEVAQKHMTFSVPEHYEAIAPRVSTSIPQIRRDFTERYRNGARYLEAAGRKFDQPTHYARKIMELQELYSISVMNALIGIAVDEDRMDIKRFKALLKEYNNGSRSLVDPEEANEPPVFHQKDTSLTRDCSYYEDYAKESCYASGTD